MKTTIHKNQIISVESTTYPGMTDELIAKRIEDLGFIIGSDILCELHKWYSWKKIVKLTKLVVFSRRGYVKKSRKTIVAKYLYKNKILFIKNKPIQISSTSIRKKIKRIA